MNQSAPDDATLPRLTLQPGRDYTLHHGHPWLFSGAFRALPADAPAGTVADVYNATGEWVARGHLNARNSLAFRVLSRTPDEAIDADFYRRRIARAADLRRLLPADVTGYRLINAEADGLPGLIVDRYDRWLVAQFSTAGAERQRDMILDALRESLDPSGILGILVRDDIRVREREGLPVGGATVARGDVPAEIEMREGPVRYLVDPHGGQKTGFFLDQREKRLRTLELAPHLASALNLFCYTGGFALAALAGNPALRTVNVDSSAPALAFAQRNFQLNGHDPEAHRFEERDVTRYLQAAVDTAQQFDLVVVDPPAFARSNAKKERALHAYEQLNALAARVVAPDGLLLTCSCSGAVNAAEFEQAVRLGLTRAGRAAQIIEVFGPALDHPTLPGFPEDRYLKVLLLRVS